MRVPVVAEDGWDADERVGDREEDREADGRVLDQVEDRVAEGRVVDREEDREAGVFVSDLMRFSGDW